MLAAIAHLPDDAQVTVSVRKGDLMKAVEDRAGGPEVMTTGQAAKIFGYNAERWRRWAEAGAIEGAYQDADQGPWRLPRESCARHARSLQRRATRRAARVTDSSVTPITPRLARGPRKKVFPSIDAAASAQAE